jgi:hypothetical protein
MCKTGAKYNMYDVHMGGERGGGGASTLVLFFPCNILLSPAFMLLILVRSIQVCNLTVQQARNHGLW